MATLTMSFEKCIFCASSDVDAVDAFPKIIKSYT